MQYAGFWKRLLASLLGAAILGIPSLLAIYYSLRSPIGVFIAWRFGGAIMLQILSLYLLVRCGGTPGKLIVGIRVVLVNGMPIGWKNALLRNSVDLIYAAFALCLFAFVLRSVEYNVVTSLAWGEVGTYWRQVYPSWSYRIKDIFTLYCLSEAFIMLTNRKRRAIHDFIAGTVVVIHSLKTPEGVFGHEPVVSVDADTARRN